MIIKYTVAMRLCKWHERTQNVSRIIGNTVLIEEFRTVIHSNDMTNVVCSDATSIVASMTSDEIVCEFILYHAYAKFNYMQL